MTSFKVTSHHLPGITQECTKTRHYNRSTGQDSNSVPSEYEEYLKITWPRLLIIVESLRFLRDVAIKILYAFLVCRILSTFPPHMNFPDLMSLRNSAKWLVQSSCSFCKILNCSVVSFVLSANTSLCTLFSYTCSSCSFCSKHEATHKAIGKIIGFVLWC
jgi:hypothetical protein